MNDKPVLPTGSDAPGPALPVEGFLRPVTLPGGEETIEQYREGEWRPLPPAVGQVMRIDTPQGWRVEMFGGDRWLCLGEFELKDGRVKRLGSFPHDDQIREAATANATCCAPGEKPWGTEWTFDLMGLVGLLDHLMDEHRYPPCPDVEVAPCGWVHDGDALFFPFVSSEPPVEGAVRVFRERA